jgi:hypothetical protein
MAMSLKCTHKKNIFYICNDVIDDTNRKIICTTQRNIWTGHINHYHCYDCKKKCDMSHRSGIEMSLNALGSRGSLYFPIKNCNDLQLWIPSIK